VHAKVHAGLGEVDVQTSNLGVGDAQLHS
jgi:hypothetical protein